METSSPRSTLADNDEGCPVGGMGFISGTALLAGVIDNREHSAAKGLGAANARIT